MALSLAKAIVSVVNTTLMDRALRRISGAVKWGELFEDAFKVAESVGRKLGVPDLVEAAKRGLEPLIERVERLDPELVGELALGGVELCSWLVLGFNAFKVARRMAEEFGDKGLKLKERVLVVVDDLAELGGGVQPVVKLVEWLKSQGAWILLVRRLSDREFLDISRGPSGTLVEEANRIIGGSPYARLFESGRQVLLITSPDYETFSEILRANVGEVGEGEARSLFHASAGSPTLAILMRDAGVGYGEEAVLERYYQLEDAESSLEMARATLNVRYAALRDIYNALKRMNTALLALLVQPLSRREVEVLCRDERVLERFGRVSCGGLGAYDRIVEVDWEEWRGGMSELYELSESWAHMRLFLDVLCEHEERVGRDVETLRRVLLDAATSELDETGVATGRMIMISLDNLEWLWSRGEARVREALVWGRYALVAFPSIGFRFLPRVLGIWSRAEHSGEDLLYSASYARDLLEHGGNVVGGAEAYLRLIEAAEVLMKGRTGDEATLCLRAMAYSSAALGLHYLNLHELASYYLSKAESIAESLKELVDVAMLHLYSTRARMGIDPLENLSRARESLEAVEAEGLTDSMRRFLKPHGGSAEERFDSQLREWRTSLHYSLGVVHLGRGEFGDARAHFQEAYRSSKDPASRLAAAGWLCRIEVIENYRFELRVGGEELDFEKLWRECGESIVRLASESIACICAEYIASEMVKGRLEGEEMGFARLDSDTYSLLCGLACVMGFMDGETAVRELEKLDISQFNYRLLIAEPAEYVALLEARGHVEALYNHALNRDEEYEVRRRVEVGGTPVSGVPTMKAWQVVQDSQQALARTMMFYIAGDLECAYRLAELVSSKLADREKLLKTLFNELSQAIRRELEGACTGEGARRAFVKLFYLHI